MTLNDWIDLFYLLAAIGFIVALKGLSSPKHARNGNLLGAAAATLAVGFTFAYPQVRAHSLNLSLTVVAMVIGAAIAVPAARLVKMTAMPQMVAAFNGVGGGAAALVSIVAFVIEAPAEARGLPDCGGALRGPGRCGVLFGERDRFRQASGADDRSPGDLSGPAVHQRGGRDRDPGARDRDAADRQRHPPRGHRRPLARSRRHLRPADRRRGCTGAHLAPELVHRSRGGRLRIHPQQQPVDHRGHPGRCVGHAPHPTDEQGDGALTAQHPFQRVRFRGDRNRWCRRRRRDAGR